MRGRPSFVDRATAPCADCSGRGPHAKVAQVASWLPGRVGEFAQARPSPYHMRPTEVDHRGDTKIPDARWAPMPLEPMNRRSPHSNPPSRQRPGSFCSRGTSTQQEKPHTWGDTCGHEAMRCLKRRLPDVASRRPTPIPKCEDADFALRPHRRSCRPTGRLPGTLPVAKWCDPSATVTSTPERNDVTTPRRDSRPAVRLVKRRGGCTCGPAVAVWTRWSA
jgi:hypothetical protein